MDAFMSAPGTRRGPRRCTSTGADGHTTATSPVLSTGPATCTKRNRPPPPPAPYSSSARSRRTRAGTGPVDSRGT